MLIILIVRKFPDFYLAVPDFLPTFANGLQMIVVYPAGRPFRLWLLAAGFFLCLIGKNIFPNWENLFS
nr:MAG TPA: hypothetical protein [Caudoviricetes sp.]